MASGGSETINSSMPSQLGLTKKTHDSVCGQEVTGRGSFSEQNPSNAEANICFTFDHIAVRSVY